MFQRFVLGTADCRARVARNWHSQNPQVVALDSLPLHLRTRESSHPNHSFGFLDRNSQSDSMLHAHH